MSVLHKLLSVTLIGLALLCGTYIYPGSAIAAPPSLLFTVLPAEIFGEIAKYCDPASLVSLSQVSRVAAAGVSPAEKQRAKDALKVEAQSCQTTIQHLSSARIAATQAHDEHKAQIIADQLSTVQTRKNDIATLIRKLGG